MLSNNPPNKISFISKSNSNKNINHRNTSKLEAGLYVTSTPIGNLKDFTIRGIETLQNVDIIACEDTRRSRKLLNYYNIKNKLISYHDYNEKKVLPKLISNLLAGKSIALISDAGTPLINDPGYKIVSECIKRKIRVFSIPGACSIIAALSVSGLPVNQFIFLGFFPTKINDRKKLISTISVLKTSIVFFETPVRLKKTLEFLNNYFPERQISICKELTKIHESTIVKKITETLSDEEIKKPKGEYVLVLGPDLSKSDNNEDEDSMLTEALQFMKISEAISQVSSLTGTSKKELYSKAIQIKKSI